MDSAFESYLGLYISLAILAISTILVYYIFAFMGESFKYLRARIKGEQHRFTFLNPLKKIYTDVQNFKNWLKLKKQQINIVIQAFFDIKWFFNKNIQDDQTKNAFIAYSGIIFFVGAFSSEIYDLIIQFDLFLIAYNFLRAM